MLEFESARQHFVRAAPASNRERVLLQAAHGRVLAEPLSALRAVPEFDSSAMDGYAVASETTQQLPFCLRVVGEAPAGSPPAELRPGTAMRIFTGAAIPAGANAVVMQERVSRDGQTIIGHEAVRPGQHVRQRGEELADSALALDRGQRLHPAALALASFLDMSEVVVARSPGVVILCTGSELRIPGSEARPGTIAESNSATIAWLTRQAGGRVLGIERVEDEASGIRGAIEQALLRSDVLVTIGGISVGDYDFVRPALQAAGVALELCQVGIKPGKPITLGRRGENVVIGLPGNPVSAVVTFALFAMPLLRAMQGDCSPIPLPVWVPALTQLAPDPKRTRVVLGNLVRHEGRTGFVPHANQSSGATIALGQSDGLVILEPGPAPAPSGALLPYHRWTDL